MIRELTLQDVGPARRLDFQFAPRLNVMTGDNGLGKTFVLDVLWWVLTMTWAGEKAFPWRPPEEQEAEAVRTGTGPGPGIDPEIRAVLHERAGYDPPTAEIVTHGRWQSDRQEWISTHRPERSPSGPEGLVVYVRIDGSYAVWDGAYVEPGASTFAEAAVVLGPQEVWDGKEVADPAVQGGRRKVIAGLIADWVSWQQRVKSDEFVALQRVLHGLSLPDEPLLLGEPTRVHLRDRRDIPTLRTKYSTVPVTLASAGVRRTLALAYLLVWAWTEHRKAARQRGHEPTAEMVLLIDEPEMHLHPAWQRVYLPAVLRAFGMIAPNAALQVFTATHSPLILASLESIFCEELDDLFVLARDGGVVHAQELPFSKEGDASSWLSSEVFGRVGGRSPESALAVAAAMDFMAERPEEAERKLAALGSRLQELPPNGTGRRKASSVHGAGKARPLAERIHEALKQTLPGHDEFWVHWTLVYRPSRGRSRRRDAAR